MLIIEISLKQTFLFTGNIYNATTNLPVASTVTIETLPDHSNVAILQTSSANGAFSINLKTEGDYYITIKNEGFAHISEYLSPDPAVLKTHKIYKQYLVQPVKVVKEALNNIYFDLNKWNLRPESYRQLDRVIEILKEEPLAKIKVDAYADDQGSKAYNVILSEKRSATVKNYMISKAISGDRILIRNNGPESPATSNKTFEGRQFNRRVEFKIVNTD